MMLIRLNEILSFFKVLNLNLLHGTNIAWHQNWNKLDIRLNKANGLTIGNYLKCRPHCSIRVDGGKMNIGHDCFFNCNVSVTCLESINIGNNVQIGNNTVIVDHNHDYQNGNGYICKNVVIEDNTWIGANCVILPGVSIKEGAIIAAGSVVNKDVPAYTVVAGNPAKVVREYNKNEKKKSFNSNGCI